MKSVPHGDNTLGVEVTQVTGRGFWLLVEGRELYLPYGKFPWFKHATIRQITAVKRPSAGHLCWPELDVDLAIDSIEHPERYPLVSRAARSPASPPVRKARQAARSGGRG